MGGPDITLADWLKSNPPAPERYQQTLATVSERSRAGEDFFAAVREWLDEAALMGDAETRAASLVEPPEPTGESRYDAYLAALGEHYSAVWQIDRPSWTVEPSRFLARFWFVSDVEGFRALLLAQSPAAFRRRGVFVSAGSLERV